MNRTASSVLRFFEAVLLRNPAFVLAALACLAAGCRPSTPPPLAPQELLIQFTCDTHGRLVPCGCFEGQFGGLTRLRTVLNVMTNDGLPALRFDAGDAIGGKEDYHVMEYRRILQAYALMKYEAVNLGHREARLSAETLRSLKAASPVPMLSANLLEQDTGKPVADAYRILQRGPLRIAVVGVLDSRGSAEFVGNGLRVESMQAVLAKLLPELRPKVDLVILLAFTDEATMDALAQEFYEIDLILGGNVRQPAQRLAKANRSLIYFTTNEARTMAWLRLRVNDRNKIEPLESDIIFLQDTIPQDPEIEALAAGYRAEVRQARLNIDSPERLQEDMIPGVRTVAEFAGSDSCLKCHPTAAQTWEKSGHAHAFATLVRKQADADPKCIECHTIGFGTPSGYRREYGAARLVDVGCESCHGPGSLHVRQHGGDKKVSFKFRPLGAGDCRKCHYGEFSRPFDWDTFWPGIAHGKEEKPPPGVNTVQAAP